MWYSGLNTKGPRIYPWHGANGWNLADTTTGVYFFFQYGGYFLPKVTLLLIMAIFKVTTVLSMMYSFKIEQVTFWAKWVLIWYHYQSKRPVLIWFKNQVHTPTFWDISFVCKTISSFSESVFEKSTFKVVYYYSFGWQVAENAELFLESAWKSNRNYMEVIGNITEVCEKKLKSQNWQMSDFSPQCQLQLPITQNRPVQLISPSAISNKFWGELPRSFYPYRMRYQPSSEV